MPIPSFESRELFHLNVLRHLSPRLAHRTYAVKGGLCLRFFHRSPRLSEDMDIDVLPQISVKSLEKAVDTVLISNSFQGGLSPYGVVKVQFAKPKQTSTTQRWKITLQLGANVSIPTKLEFSRRSEKIVYSQGIPGPEVLNHYRMVPFAAKYYGPEVMVVQKLRAIASPSRNAVRDLFDLDHLLHTLSVDPRPLYNVVGAEVVEQASDKVKQFSYEEFKRQVRPFLIDSLTELYRNEDQFELLKENVEKSLIGMLP